MNKTRVMIVEDEVIIAYDLKQRLEGEGFEVLPVVSSAEQAIASSADHHPDIILMDMVLKGDRTGLDAAREIQSRDSCSAFIFLTGNRQIIDRQGLDDMRNYSIISKPAFEKQLVDEIRRLARAPKKDRE